MKVISLLEPWASLVKEGIKQTETRSWATKYRGELYIHTSKRVLTRQNLIDYQNPLSLLPNTDFEYGYIIAKCQLVDCRLMDSKLIEEIKTNYPEQYLCGIWQVDRYMWVLKDIQALKMPIPAKGHLGIWNYHTS
ncbi:ASCH domain-containing protein [Candidatus Saccharibacteria bacterium]|nr:ASCH domain-containing protein [Candidatus Saccharibacteria bacterium]